MTILVNLVIENTIDLSKIKDGANFNLGTVLPIRACFLRANAFVYRRWFLP